MALGRLKDRNRVLGTEENGKPNNDIVHCISRLCNTVMFFYISQLSSELEKQDACFMSMHKLTRLQNIFKLLPKPDQ